MNTPANAGTNQENGSQSRARKIAEAPQRVKNFSPAPAIFALIKRLVNTVVGKLVNGDYLPRKGI